MDDVIKYRTKIQLEMIIISAFLNQPHTHPSLTNVRQDDTAADTKKKRRYTNQKFELCLRVCMQFFFHFSYTLKFSVQGYQNDTCLFLSSGDIFRLFFVVGASRKEVGSRF